MRSAPLLFLGVALPSLALCGLVAGQPSSGVLAAPSVKPTVVATLHAHNLETTLKLIKSYVPVPLKPEGALGEVFGEFGQQVALGLPADLVVGLEPQSGEAPAQPLLAFAVGVGSFEEA